MVNIGRLREATALCPRLERLAVVSDDPLINKLGLRVVEVYPDTTGRTRSVVRILQD